MGLQIIGGLAKDSAEARSGLAQYQAKLSEFNEKNAALTPAEERDKKHAMDRIEELEHKMDQIEAADAMVAKFAPQFEERMASMAETPPRARNKVPARAISKTTTSFESNQAAYDAGRWVQAVLLGDPSAKQHCMDRGILNSMSGGDAQKGEILFLKSWKTALLNRGNPLV